MSSISLDGPNPELSIIGARIAQKSQQTIANVVSQAVEAGAQINAQSAQAAPGPGKGQNVDVSA